MDKSIFGSTCSLGGLLNDVLLMEGDADQFLGDLSSSPLPASKGLDFLPSVDGSGATSLESSLSGFGTDEVSEPHFSSPLPSANVSLPQAWQPTSSGPLSSQPPASTSTPQPPNNAANLAILQQLLGVIQSGSLTAPAAKPEAHQQPPAGSLLAQCAAAFKPAAPAVQQFAPVTQGVPSSGTAAPAPLPVPAATPTTPLLPSLNAQQQQALQTIMALGQLGTTSEGKKVRRMLSNRESARRSRHRKQAHMADLEERAGKMDAENLSMKEALTRAAQQEQQAAAERTRLYSEIGQLREKVTRLESSAVQSKLSDVKVEVPAKRGTSHGSVAGGTSEDSCCDSLPAKGRSLEASDNEGTCCKRCRMACA